jgi:DNA ligase (NAD+)
MNIDGLGEETVDAFYKEGLVKSVADLYKLNAADIANLERMGEKSAQNIIDGINSSRNIPFERVVYAIGIRFVGETVAKKLAYAFKDIDSLMSATKEQLIAVDEIGERIADSVLKYFANEDNRTLIESLRSEGVQLKLSEERISMFSDTLNGLSIVISGTFEKHSRDEYKALIEQHGGKNTSSVSAKTDYILAGDNMGPAKLEKAQKLGVKIISENEFLEMIGEL